MGSSRLIDGIVCNDFSPQARLAAALAAKLKAVGKVEPAAKAIAKKKSAPVAKKEFKPVEAIKDKNGKYPDADKVASVDPKTGTRFNKYGDPLQDGPLTAAQKAYRTKQTSDVMKKYKASGQKGINF